MSLDCLIFWQPAQGMVICIWMDLLHTCSPESRYPHLSQYISDREGRNHPFQKNWARAKGECWSNVVGISYRVRKKIILKAYKIPGAVISAAGSTYVFGVTPCLCQSWSSLRKTNEFFTPGASCPNTNIFIEKQSSLDFYLCVWYSSCTEAKDTATRQKNIDVLRCCMRAPNVGLLHYPRKGGSRLSWLPGLGRVARARGCRMFRLKQG